jgi:hypothetical protein
MLTVNRHQKPDGLQIDMSGAIEENVNFEQLIGDFTGELTVNCRGVTRINSVGVKTWIRYFQNLKFQRKNFKFTDVSYPLIEQLNMILNFACGGEVESILLPFSCIRCQTEFVASCGVKELLSNQLKVPTFTCEKDQCAAQFDDDPEEYLYFLKE